MTFSKLRLLAGLLIAVVTTLVIVACAAPGIPAVPVATREVTAVRRAFTMPATDKSGDIIAVTNAFSSDPKDLLRVIGELFPVTIAFEPNAFHVILRGTPDAVEDALSAIEHLEGASVVSEAARIKTVHLKYARARNVADVMQGMIDRGFFSASQRPVTIISDDRTNSVVICSDIRYEEIISSIVVELDEFLNPSPPPPQEIRIERGNLVPVPEP